MRSPYHANCSDAREREIAELEEARTFEDGWQRKGGNVVSAKWVFTHRRQMSMVR